MTECFRTTKSAANDIIKLKGMTYYGVAAGLVRIVETILRDESTLLTVSCVASHCAIEEVCLSVPAKLNRNGAEHVKQILLNQEERNALLKSAESVKAAINPLNLK
jgi:L-lactate dehydrogenase